MLNHFDWPYAILYLILIFLAFQYKKSHQKGLVTASIVAVFIFVGFRAPVVGADTFRYIGYLTGEIGINSLITDDRDVEYLFVIYKEIVNFFTSSRFLVMVINTFVAFSPVFYLYKHYSFNPPLSFLLFFFLNCTNLYFIGLRQILGFSFVLWGLLYYLKHDLSIENNTNIPLFKRLNIRGLLMLLITTGIGYFFHSSMIIYGAIIIFLLFVPLKSKWIAALLILGSFLIGVVFRQLDVLGIFNDIYMMGVADNYRLGGYLQHTGEYEITGTVSLFRFSLIGLTSVLFIEKEQLNHIFTKLFLTGIILFNIFLTVPMLARFNSALYMFGAVVFTWVLTKRNRRSLSFYMSKLMISVTLLYFCYANFMYLGRLDPVGKLRPYYFIFQDYPNHE